MGRPRLTDEEREVRREAYIAKNKIKCREYYKQNKERWAYLAKDASEEDTLAFLMNFVRRLPEDRKRSVVASLMTA